MIRLRGAAKRPHQLALIVGIAVAADPRRVAHFSVDQCPLGFTAAFICGGYGNCFVP